MKSETKRKIGTYAIAIAIPLAVGTLSALLTRGSMGIYGEITSPPLAPPGWLFPIVWTLLYVLMGVSSAIVYLERNKDIVGAVLGLRYYAISLIFNFAWSIIFFNLRRFFLAFIWLLFLIYFIVKTVLQYRKASPLAAYLQIPYILWVIFAGYLNLAIWYLN